MLKRKVTIKRSIFWFNLYDFDNYFFCADDNLNKSKKNNLYGNEDSAKVDSSIILIHNDNVKTTVYENYDLLSNQFIFQTNDCSVGQSYNFETVEPELGKFV